MDLITGKVLQVSRISGTTVISHSHSKFTICKDGGWGGSNALMIFQARKDKQ